MIEPRSQKPVDRSGRFPAKTFRDLIVWKRAHDFVLRVYNFSRGFPREEQFGLTSQFRRAAVSVTANIAEGFTRKTAKDKLRFYNIAEGSLEECRYYLILAKDLGYGPDETADKLADEVGRLLKAFTKAIEKDL